MTTSEIKELQAALGLTYDQFARLIGVNTRTVYAWYADPRRRRIEAIENRLREIKREAEEQGILIAWRRMNYGRTRLHRKASFRLAPELCELCGNEPETCLCGEL